MKQVCIIILALITAGGFANMDKERVKQNIFKDAQDINIYIGQEELTRTFKVVLLQNGFSNQEIIDIAKEYISLYPEQNKNLLDLELRVLAIQGQNYFTGYGPVVPKVKTQKSEPKIPWILALLGGGVLIYAIARRK